jgi:hypothetical protein
MKIRISDIGLKGNLSNVTVHRISDLALSPISDKAVVMSDYINPPLECFCKCNGIDGEHAG